jgi:hypothetical protein
MCVQIWETSLDQSFQLIELQVKMLEMFSKREIQGLEVYLHRNAQNFLNQTYTVNGIGTGTKKLEKEVVFNFSNAYSRYVTLYQCQYGTCTRDKHNVLNLFAIKNRQKSRKLYKNCKYGRDTGISKTPFHFLISAIFFRLCLFLFCNLKRF